jgi:alcohol dehydrogenase, propanol-preferring
MNGACRQSPTVRSAIDDEDNPAFSLRHGIRPMTETRSLAEAPAAYEHMLSGAARFRVVLTMP